MFIEKNIHPQGKIVGDCVVRAYALALNKDYMEARKELNRLKRKLNFRSYKDRSFLKELYKNYEKLSFPAQKGYSRMNGFTFMLDYPKGTYILNMARHHTVCIDGNIYDTWDCTDKCVYNAWRII